VSKLINIIIIISLSKYFGEGEGFKASLPNKKEKKNGEDSDLKKKKILKLV
jgi:hypothetical protein